MTRAQNHVKDTKETKDTKGISQAGCRSDLSVRPLCPHLRVRPWCPTSASDLCVRTPCPTSVSFVTSVSFFSLCPSSHCVLGLVCALEVLSPYGSYRQCQRPRVRSGARRHLGVRSRVPLCRSRIRDAPHVHWPAVSLRAAHAAAPHLGRHAGTLCAADQRSDRHAFSGDDAHGRAPGELRP